jgi:hypothetical protein
VNSWWYDRFFAGLVSHAQGDLVHHEHQPHLGSLRAHGADEVANHPGVELLTALDADDNPPGPLVVQREADDTIGTTVTHLPLDGDAADQAYGQCSNSKALAAKSALAPSRSRGMTTTS